MRRIVSRLGSNRFVRRAAWTAGEVVHRRLGDGLLDAVTRVRRERPRQSGADAVERSESDRIRPFHLDDAASSPPFRPVPMSSASDPVLTAADVTDYGAVDFVADPFLFVPETGPWRLFFEVYNRDRRPTGVVGHAISTDRGRSWEYDRVVLQDEIHLAFPYIFKWEGTFYMVPDRWNRERPAAIRLFETDSLPGGWRPVSTVVDPDRQLADCVLFRWNDRWWAMLGSDDGNHDLCLYYSDDLLRDEWTPHEQNPVASGRPEAGRPAGRPIVTEDGILVFFQDCAAQYGDKVRAFDVERLSPTAYADRERPESPILEGSDRRLGWNSGRMHHVDPWYTADGWRCAVDGNVGWGRRAFGPNHWSVGMYEVR
jgi:hypothetical protein